MSYQSSPSRNTAYAILATTSVAVITWRVLQWRARSRAKLVAERAQRMMQDGPLIDCADAFVRLRVLNTGVRRAQKWISFQSTDTAKTMHGQVGGISEKKKPILTLAPDYLLKPLQTDTRGFREIAFYEAIKLASQNGGAQGNNNGATASTGGGGGENGGGAGSGDGNVNNSLYNCDTVAMWLAIFMRDQIVAESEQTLLSSWRAMRKEIELLRRLSTFTAPYYGVVGQDLVQQPVEGPIVKDSEISPNAYLLLGDATSNFSKPCSIDLKIGYQTSEPDSPPEKIEREFQKYPQQKEFGFRIVGMRVYDPCNLESDESGFRTFDKTFGTGLTTRESVLDGLRLFFQCVDMTPDDQPQQKARGQEWKGSPITLVQEGIRVRVIMRLLSQLRVIMRWFEDNKSFAFYASSILMVYEGDVNVGGNCDVPNLKMIDFGHVRKQAGGDKGYLHGLSTIMTMMKEMLDESPILGAASY